MYRISTVADVLADMKATSGKENSQKAYEVFEEIYTKRGITQTQDEVIAAKQSFKAINDISAKTLTGRYVLPLSAGSGKTTFMVAWCSFIHRHKVDYSVAIASFQVKDCFNLRQQLIAQGVPEEDIGVIHSYSADEMAEVENPCPSTSTPWKHRFLLVTHERLKDKNRRNNPLSFHGEDRSIIFWDEEFRSRKGFHFDIHGLRKDISGFVRVADDVSKDISNEDMSTVKQVLQGTLTALESHLEHKEKPKQLSITTNLGSDTQRKAILKAFRKLHRQKQLGETTLSFLEHLIEGNYMDMKGSTVFGYEKVISDDIQQMLILDASYKLSKLSQMDEDVIELPISIPRTYSNLTVTYTDCPSGRSSTARMLGTPKERADLIERLAEHLRGIPEDEAVLIFTYTDKGNDEFEAVIRRELSQLGFNMDERITTKDGQHKPKYAFLTWGRQNGTNDYMYCRHMCTIGVLDLGTDNIIAQAVAQTKGRYLFDDEALSAHDLNLSDCAQKIYQAIFRTAVRNHGDDTICTATLFLNKNAMGCIDILKEALPKVKPIKAAPVLKGKETSTARWTKVLIDVLEGLPEHIGKISTSSLLKLAEEKTKDTISPKVRDLVMTELRRKLDYEYPLWRQTGRSLERLFFMAS